MVRVKICGLTRVDEALACAEAGADWIGLNFHPGSPRYVRPEEAAAIVAALPDSVAAVGVFVDRPAEQVAELAERLGSGSSSCTGRSRRKTCSRSGRSDRPGVSAGSRQRTGSEVTDYLGRAGSSGRAAGCGPDRRVRGRSAGRHRRDHRGRGSGRASLPCPA